MTPARYGMYIVAHDPTIGRETAKPHPVVVVSMGAMNRHAEAVVECPHLTKLNPTWRSHIQLRGAGKPAEIAADQIRTIGTLQLAKNVDALAVIRGVRRRRGET